ncbi:hypothetical protein [Photobacterium sp. GB-72]|nr:hypothetical protein [Photobacterium sp. GB-72]
MALMLGGLVSGELWVWLASTFTEIEPIKMPPLLQWYALVAAFLICIELS